MNYSQLRHAKSIARHILEHVEQLERSMATIESLSEQEVRGFPVERMEARFEQDTSHAIKKIQQVLADMLPDLKNQ